MENQMNNEEKEISIFEIFSWIWVKKWVCLIVSFVIFILAMIFILFFYNPSSSVYTASFRYANIPGLDAETYLDGTKFNYRDLISRKYVEEVISSNKEQYGSIDVDKLYRSNNLTIGHTYTYRDEENEDFTIIATDYIMAFPTKIFKNKYQARSFISDLISVPIQKTAVMIQDLSYDVNLKMYDEALTFGGKLEYIENQVNLITSGYNSYISQFGDIYVTIDNERYKLSQLKLMLSDYLGGKNYGTMSAELRLNGYVRDINLERERYQIQMKDLKETNDYLVVQRTDLEARYDELKTILNGSGSNVQIITSEALTVLVSKLADIDSQINSNEESQRILQKKIDMLDAVDKSACDRFGARLDEIRNKLTSFTEDYTVVDKNLTERNMTIYYMNSNIIKTEGGIGLILALVIGVAGGLVIGCIVAGVLGHNAKTGSSKGKKEEKNSLEN